MQNIDSHCIPLTRTPRASPLFVDYLYHYDRVERFYQGSPQDYESFRAVGGAIRGLYPHRAWLAEALERENRAFGCGEATIENIRRLRGPETFAVVTGQQVGLFSGPAFTLYKALTAIRLARSLSEQGLASVPVFWLATEDHDLDEVSAAAVLNDAGELVNVKAGSDRPAPACSVGYAKLASDVSSAVEAVESALPNGPPRDHLISDLRGCYAPGVGWGEAFGRFITRLFGRFGVVLIDPLREDFHRQAQPVYAKALADAPRLRQLLDNRSRELAGAGYRAQVHVGGDSTLMFAAVDGNRSAIHERAGEFQVEGRERSTTAGIEAWCQSRPLDFTPSALLRPVVQDRLLPTVAYISGPAELAYFAQAHAIYPEFGRPAPVLFPRAGFTLADRHDAKLMEKYRLSLEDVWRGEDHLRRRIAAAAFEGAESQSWAERMNRSEEALAQSFDALSSDVGRIDATLVDALRTTREKVTYQLDRLRGKISRAVVERSELLTRHEKSLLARLAPGGELQEREVSGINFLGRAGYELLDTLLDQIQTRCMDHQYFVY
ncbi:MAG: bacillithiol biosynthesis cysteine-adding enzyme BshC [Terriglobia bacterium]